MGMSVPQRMSVCSFTARDYGKKRPAFSLMQSQCSLCPRPSYLGNHCIIRTPVTSVHWEIQLSMEPELLTAGCSRCVCHSSRVRLGPMCTCTLKTCCLLNLCLCVCACMSACAPHACRCPWRPEEGVRAPETGLSGCCEMPN